MKKYYLKSLLWAVLALCCADVWAADVDASAAQAAASAFIQSQSSGKFQAAASSTLRLAHAELSAVRSNAVDYYVFNTAESGDEGVFIIVAGDDRAKQILAYGEGRMDVQTLPSNAKWWLEQYKQQIEWLQTHSSATEPSPGPKRAATDGVTVEPMLTCTWSQMAPYYDQCPDDEYGRCVTGCVATAMAQVMYYWHFPAELPELTGYESSYFGNYNITVDPLPATVLDWEHMLDSYSRNSSAEEGAAVATLMRYCGQACFMQYSSEGSSSTGMSQLMAFRTFGYNKQARFVARDGYDKEQWVTMLADELLAGRPVPYCGRGDGGGHAFVVDGCKDGKFHMNWGWGGVSDGYYEIDAFVSSSFDFRFGHDMNVGICPNNDDMPAPEATYDFEVDGIYYLKNGTEATVTYRDESLDSYSGDIEVPEWVEWEGVNYRVTSVGDLAFSYSPSLTSLRLPHIKNIGNNIIDGCVGLKELYMGRELESIKSSTWYSCPLLHWIDV